MARIAPLNPADTDAGDNAAELQALIDFVGYRPNALFTMARRPGLLNAVLGLVRSTVRGPGQLPETLRFLIAAEASRSARCRYTAAHVAHAAAHAGMALEKIIALPDRATSPLFSAAECAALDLAAAGGLSPMGDTGPAFAAAAAHYDTASLHEIVVVIAAFGWFNRWNCLMQSDLEAEPAAFAEQVPWLKMG